MKNNVMVFILVFVTLPVYSQWQQTNYHDGVKCMLVNGTDVFAGTYSNGIWLSQDNGNTWVEKSSGMLTPDVYSMVISGSTIFAGSYSGVYMSQNNGDTWTVARTPIGTVNTLAISGVNLFAGNNSGNIFLSQNNGSSWTLKSSGLAAYSIISLATGCNNTFAGTDNGVYRTRDNGDSWLSLRNGISKCDVYSLWVSGNKVFAGTYLTGIYMSGDSGESWSVKNNGLPDYSVVYSFICIDSLIIAGTGDGVYTSSDWGNSWVAKNEGFPDSQNVLALCFDESWIFAGTPIGVWKYPLSTFGIDGNNAMSKIRIYPNPASDRFFLSCSTNDPDKIKTDIYNIHGKPMKFLTNRLNDKIEFLLENYPKGIYFIKIQRENITEYSKLVVN
jgi:photosystem II stability/assembly factor-like uncharacterized protein